MNKNEKEIITRLIKHSNDTCLFMTADKNADMLSVASGSADEILAMITILIRDISDRLFVSHNELLEKMKEVLDSE